MSLLNAIFASVSLGCVLPPDCGPCGCNGCGNCYECQSDGCHNACNIKCQSCSPTCGCQNAYTEGCETCDPSTGVITELYDISTQFCCSVRTGCSQTTGTPCNNDVACCNGKCCDPGQCCDNGVCKGPICDNCQSFSNTAYECYHGPGDTICACNMCIINIVNTATCDPHPDSPCPPNCPMAPATGNPPASYQFLILSTSVCSRCGDSVYPANLWFKYYQGGCTRCDTYREWTACETSVCPGTMIDFSIDGVKYECSGTCP